MVGRLSVMGIRPTLSCLTIIFCSPLSHPRYQRNPRFKTSVAAETRWAIRGSVYQPSTLSHLTLVNVRLGELESVLDQFDAWLGSTFDDNFHGIETKRNLRIIQHAQPGESAARDASPLIVPD